MFLSPVLNELFGNFPSRKFLSHWCLRNVFSEFWKEARGGRSGVGGNCCRQFCVCNRPVAHPLNDFFLPPELKLTRKTFLVKSFPWRRARSHRNDRPPRRDEAVIWIWFSPELCDVDVGTACNVYTFGPGFNASKRLMISSSATPPSKSPISVLIVRVGTISCGRIIIMKLSKSKHLFFQQKWDGCKRWGPKNNKWHEWKFFVQNFIICEEIKHEFFVVIGWLKLRYFCAMIRWVDALWWSRWIFQRSFLSFSFVCIPEMNDTYWAILNYISIWGLKTNRIFCASLSDEIRNIQHKSE